MSTCCHKSWDYSYQRRCKKTAKYEHEGKPYCGIHYPPNVEARKQKTADRWKAESEAAQAKARQIRIESDIDNLCAQWVRDHRQEVYELIRRRVEEQPR